MRKTDDLGGAPFIGFFLLVAAVLSAPAAWAQDITAPKNPWQLPTEQTSVTPLSAEALTRIEATIDSLRQLKVAAKRAAKSGQFTPSQKIASSLQNYARAAQSTSTTGKSTLSGWRSVFDIDASGAVRVQVRLDDASGSSIAALRSQVELQYVSTEYNTAFARIPADRLRDIAAFDFVREIDPVFIGNRVVHTGAFTTEADAFLGGPLIRSLGIDGTGVRVGVISNGTQGIATAVATGDIPDDGAGNLDVDFCPTGTDPGEVPVANQGSEGTAMMEIIHDIAPGADLGFCPAFGGGEPGLAASIDYLANDAFGGAGSDIIVDDVAFLSEPYFEDGIVARAVDNAAGGGTAYFSSAGNSAQRHYEASYVDNASGGQPPFPNAHDFGVAAGEASNIFQNGLVGGTPFAPNNFFAAFLQWNDPFGSSSNDYDLYIFDRLGFPAGSADGIFPTGSLGLDFQGGTEDPLEVAFVVNETPNIEDVVLVVDRFSGDPKELEVNYNGTLAILTFNEPSGSVWGHAAAAGAISVGAIDVADPGRDDIQTFSSQGPSNIYFPAFEARNTPTLASYDGVTVSGAGGFPTTFFGTSAAAPHAAAVAALLKQTNPELDPAGVRSELISTATDLGASGFDFIFGNGRIEGVSPIAKSVCDSPVLAGGDMLDEGVKTITNTIQDSDGIAQVEFTKLKNVFVASMTSPAGRFTSSDGIVWTAPSDPGPPNVTYTLQATENSGSYFVVATDDCIEPRTTDFDPPYDFGLEAPDRFAAMGNYPNPFRSTTKIRFALPEQAAVTLEVYDIMGRRVATIVDREIGAGAHEVVWNGRAEDGSPLASGVYLYRLKAGTNVATQRLTLVR